MPPIIATSGRAGIALRHDAEDNVDEGDSSGSNLGLPIHYLIYPSQPSQHPQPLAEHDEEDVISHLSDPTHGFGLTSMPRNNKKRAKKAVFSPLRKPLARLKRVMSSTAAIRPPPPPLVQIPSVDDDGEVGTQYLGQISQPSIAPSPFRNYFQNSAGHDESDALLIFQSDSRVTSTSPTMTASPRSYGMEMPIKVSEGGAEPVEESASSTGWVLYGLFLWQTASLTYLLGTADSKASFTIGLMMALYAPIILATIWVVMVLEKKRRWRSWCGWPTQ